MALRDAEDQLFAEWREKRSVFYPDGVVNEDAWRRNTPKILLLMKEVNEPNGRGRDLRKILSTTDRQDTWDSVTRWMRAVRALPAELPWQDVKRVRPEHRREHLGSLAVMNLKKTPGRHTTDVKKFRKIVAEDQSFLRRQFALYDADLVICCGSEVTKAFSAWIGAEHAKSWKRTRRGIKFLQFVPGRHVIDYAHPEARVAPFLLHYPLIDAIREIRLDATNRTAEPGCTGEQGLR